MARCSSSEAKGLPVVTKSGQAIGTVSGFIFDTDRGSIAQIEVRPAGLVRGFVAHELLIAWDEVIEWTETHIVVSDAMIPARTVVVPSIAPSV